MDQDEKYSYGEIRERCNARCKTCSLSCKKLCPCLFLHEESDEEEESHDFEDPSQDKIV